MQEFIPIPPNNHGPWSGITQNHVKLIQLIGKPYTGSFTCVYSSTKYPHPICKYTILYDIDINVNNHYINTCLCTIQRSYENGHQNRVKNVHLKLYRTTNAAQLVLHHMFSQQPLPRCLDQSRIVGDQHQTALKPPTTRMPRIPRKVENSWDCWVYPYNLHDHWKRWLN